MLRIVQKYLKPYVLSGLVVKLGDVVYYVN